MAKARKPKAGKCVVPECDGNARARGLCWGCYQAAYRLVRNGDTSWPALEKRGLAGSIRQSKVKRQLSKG